MNAAIPGASSPLHRAVDNDCPNIARHLLDHAAEINAVNRDGNTPLMVACDSGNRLVRTHVGGGGELHVLQIMSFDSEQNASNSCCFLFPLE